MPEDSTQPQIGGSLQPDCWAASFLAKLDAELLKVVKAQERFKYAERWTEYHRLTGERLGLIQAKRWLKETQPNAKAQRPGPPDAGQT